MCKCAALMGGGGRGWQPSPPWRHASHGLGKALSRAVGRQAITHARGARLPWACAEGRLARGSLGHFSGLRASHLHEHRQVPAGTSQQRHIC